MDEMANRDQIVEHMAHWWDMEDGWRGRRKRGATVGGHAVTGSGETANDPAYAADYHACI